MERYFPAPFAATTLYTQTHLSWIRKYDETIETSAQTDLLERIWADRSRHIVDNSELVANGDLYIYFLDFENRTMEIENVIEGTINIPFKDLRVGMIDEISAQFEEKQKLAKNDWRRKKKAEAFERGLAMLSKGGYHISNWG